MVEPIFELQERADEQEAVAVNIAGLTNLIERYIRRYPHEWGWMHRRWKSKPSGYPDTRISGEPETIVR